MGEKDDIFVTWLTTQMENAKHAMELRANERAYGLAGLWHTKREVYAEVLFNFRRLREAEGHKGEGA